MSSIILKSRRVGLLEKNRRVFWCLLGPCCLATVWFLFSVKLQRVQSAELLSVGNPSLPSQAQPRVSQEYLADSDAYSPPNFILELRDAPEIDAHSLTAILPVTLESLPALEDIISPLLSPSTRLREILVVCPDAILSQTRRILRKVVVAEETFIHPDISLRPWIGDVDQSTGVMRIASHVSTEWILLLHETGLQQVNSHTRDMLLIPKAVTVPVGPRGVIFSPNNISCVISSQRPQRASYLIPPFVIPSFLVHEFPQSHTRGVWASLGERISQLRPDALGGIVMASVDSELDLSSSLRQAETSPPHEITSFGPTANEIVESTCVAETDGHSGVFALLFPTLKDLHLFSPVACRLQDNGHIIRVILYDEPAGHEYAAESPVHWEERTIISGRCLLKYNVLSVDTTLPINLRRGNPFLSEWLDTLESQPDVVLAMTEQDSLVADLALIFKQRKFPDSTLIHISQRDLPYCAWMSSLSLSEWRSA